MSDAVARREDNTLDGSQRTTDNYFNVARADDLPVPQFRVALGQTLNACYLDVASGVSISDRDVEVLALGLHRLADWSQFPTSTDIDVTTWEMTAPAAIYRWKQQHHLFFVIVHGILYLLHVLEEAMGRCHAPVVKAFLQDFAELMEASEVAFRLASDFSQEAYDSEVRPDMHAFDPHFSGLFYADHKELITRLRLLRGVGDDFEQELNRIDDAITESYDVHALVCLRFVGETSSLASKDDTRVAAESIRNRYVNRTKTIAGFGKKTKP
ncbi:hypothetical protein C1J03_24515 (plasmid) [Sulfitobacter sp. SK012]|uniref:hypothetical protein n=1 Tax=Sulfitobacter sp. SK012 TaxID=1389005 RepID=UPI000E0C3B39|nr:hypothetical protein [Sulfitobacter sp. SK012]AXI49273.1 hypothetical protein C1J03_24515 [Sulfitobacter sp. SK012]